MDIKEEWKSRTRRRIDVKRKKDSKLREKKGTLDLSPLVKEHDKRRCTNSQHKAPPFLQNLSCKRNLDFGIEREREKISKRK